jgi:hypothetical protein
MIMDIFVIYYVFHYIFIFVIAHMFDMSHLSIIWNCLWSIRWDNIFIKIILIIWYSIITEVESYYLESIYPINCLYLYVIVFFIQFISLINNLYNQWLSYPLVINYMMSIIYCFFKWYILDVEFRYASI